MKPLVEQDRARIGVVGVAVVAFLAAVVVAAANLAPGTHRYTAVLEHTGGLRVGEEVQVAGVGVGTVQGIELGEEEVEVSFTLDDEIHLGQDTRAEVKVATLLGTHFLQVEPRGGQALADATIPVDRTRVPYNLQDVLDDGVPEIREFDAGRIEESLAAVAETMERSGEDLGPALDGVHDLSELVVQRSDDLGALLRAARRVSGQLNDSGGDLVELMRQADLILDTLRSRRETIRALLQDLATLGDHLSGVVDETRADMNPMLADLHRVTELLRKHEADVARTVRTLAPAGRYFGNAGGTGRWLDQYTPGATPDGINCLEKGTCE